MDSGNGTAIASKPMIKGSAPNVKQDIRGRHTTTDTETYVYPLSDMLVEVFIETGYKDIDIH